MLRLLSYMLLAIVLITLLRSVIGLMTRVFLQVMRASVSSGSGESRRAPVAVNGELKKDPVCGTYVAMSGSPYKTIGHETFYFCSLECREKFPVKV